MNAKKIKELRKTPMISTLPTEPTVVEVRCGMADYSGPFAGFAVSDVKLALETPLNIPYFCDPYVDGRLVNLDYRLAAGEDLQFIRCFGAKGTDDRSSGEAQASAFLFAFGDQLRPLVADAKARGLNLTDAFNELADKAVAFCEPRFGPVTNQAMAIVLQAVRELLKSYKKRSRMANTEDIVDLAEVVNRLDRIEHLLEQNPPTNSVLNEIERDILNTLGDDTLTGQSIADRTRVYKYNSHFRDTLAGLVRRGVLSNKGRGYFRSVQCQVQVRTDLTEANR